MARDLPYFKFYVSEWNDGDITLCSLEAQGLFVNLCSLYWSLKGKLFYASAMRRHSDCNASAWEELIKSNCIKILNDKIVINFLDEQMHEMSKISIQNKKNAEKRWKDVQTETVTENSIDMRAQCERNAVECNIEEKRREEKRERDKLPISPPPGKIEVGTFNSVRISIRARYLTESPVVIYDLQLYFTQTEQIISLQSCGWTFFEEFMTANAGKVFNEPDHLYNTFRQFCTSYKPSIKPIKDNPFAEAEYNKSLWTQEAWEKFYERELKTNINFINHFGYGKLQNGSAMGSDNQNR